MVPNNKWGQSMSVEDVTEMGWCRVVTCENWSKSCRGHCTYKVIRIDENGKCMGYKVRGEE